MAAAPTEILADGDLSGGTEQYVTAAGYRSVIRNMINTPNFDELNSHLTPEDIRGLRADPPQWPDRKPVYSPYAVIKAGCYYTQTHIEKEYTTDGKRRTVRMHRLTCLQMHGPAPVGYDASHRLGSGGLIAGSERDCNPNNLCWEWHSVNMTRAFCQQYHAARMADIRAESQVAGREVSDADVWELATSQTEKVCQVVHGPHLCHFWHPSWGKPSPLIRSRKGPNVTDRPPKGQRPMGRPRGSKDTKERKSRLKADRRRVKRKRQSTSLTAEESEPIDLISTEEEGEQKENSDPNYGDPEEDEEKEN